jgi:membrane protein implicated in regulation of membrane protease activity
LAEEASAWAVGGGIITMALFPLALPIILLTAATVIPLLLVALALGLVAAVVAAPILLLRRVVRLSRRSENGRPGDAVIATNDRSTLPAVAAPTGAKAGSGS